MEISPAQDKEKPQTSVQHIVMSYDSKADYNSENPYGYVSSESLRLNKSNFGRKV